MTPTRGLVSASILALAAVATAAPDEEPATPAKPAEPVVERKMEKVGPLTYPMPADWKETRPSSQMRVAQYEIPLVEGDSGKAELVVFFFPGGAGGVQANIDRWAGQFEATAEEPKVEEHEAAYGAVTIVDISGDFKEKPFPMSPRFTLRKGYRMLAAIVEPKGSDPYFFKLVGPAKSLEAQVKNFEYAFKEAKR